MFSYDNTKLVVRRWLLRRLPACKETVETISKLMDRPLTVREKAEVKVHLLVCSWCQWYMEHLQTIRATLRTQQTEASDEKIATMPGMSVEARERLKQKLSNPN